ncbi:MAG TPA: M20/M25/M40 family metallo-hydrolase [Pyrinomonadaceae bacterium]|jgi:acetylornithine deacetylase
MNLFDLTRNLIDIPSLTGTELEIARFLNSELQRLGYKVEVQELTAGRANLIATTGSAARVVFSTHMDTVPPHIDSSEDDDFIYGRGSCDAKGIIAAQIVAAEELRRQGVDQIGLLFTVDEEAGSDGARLANEHPVGESCEFLINGEPTDNKLAIGSKGSLRLRVKADGRAAHSAYPEHGDSAIDKLLDVLNDIRQVNWPTDEFFGETTCNIGILRGGVRANVIPASAEADLQIRLTTQSGPVKQLLESIVQPRAQIEYLSVSEPVRMLALDGFEKCVVRFTTDIPHLTNWGTPLLLGPGSILDAHTPHERVSKQALSEAVDHYVGLVKALLKTQTGEMTEGVTPK